MEAKNRFPVGEKDSISSLLKVDKQLVFVQRHDSKSFNAKLKLENFSSRYVTYLLRSSGKKKFIIEPRFGFISPKGSMEILILAQNAGRFNEISKECFGVFAAPIYDKRQLEKKKLYLLWRAHGTDIFPLDMSEFYKIPYILPKSDKYFSNLSIMGRITETNYITRHRPCTPGNLINVDKPVDAETFYLNWPSIEGPSGDNTQLEDILADWHSLSKKMTTETRSIIDNAKSIAASFLTAIPLLLFVTYTNYFDPRELFPPEKAEPIPVEEAPTFLSWAWWSSLVGSYLLNYVKQKILCRFKWSKYLSRYSVHSLQIHNCLVSVYLTVHKKECKIKVK